MSTNWSGVRASGDGILRTGSSSAVKEELLVFGYSCKLFRDDERAREVDQGRLLIPWSGDEALRIDRYDVRGALHELASLEAPPGGHDWRLELTDAERRVEQLCDEERYRALYCDEEEELMYKEEELKRLRAVGYGQIGFNYEAEKSNAPPPPAEPAEVDEPFTPSPQMQALLTPNVVLPETQKLNAIIEKTATFIARQGAQMEILLRAKQAGNTQFDFLDKESTLHRYYRIVLDAVRNNKLADHSQESEGKPDEHEDYLHPSLAAPFIESAPSIPSIHYKPSADCDYTMLISRIRGTGDKEEEPPEPAVPAGELAPPGTQPLTLPGFVAEGSADYSAYYHQYYDPTAHAQIARGPVLYAAQDSVEQHQAMYTVYPPAPDPPPVSAPAPTSAPNSGPASPAPAPVAPAAVSAAKSTGLNLMHYYNSGSESENSDDEEKEPPPVAPVLPTPPADVQLIISKMAAYVARNGDEFQDIVRAKNDPRFTFLEATHQYHAYYKRLMLQLRGVPEPPVQHSTGPDGGKAESKGRGEQGEEVKSKKDDKKKGIAPVSFSIKKLKEPEPILPKPALPYESSDEEKEPSEDTECKPTDTANSEECSTPPDVAKDEEVTQDAASQAQKMDAQVLDENVFVQPMEQSKKEKEKKREERSEKKRKKDKKRREKGESESKKRKREHSRNIEQRERSRSRERKERSRSRDKERSRSRDKERSRSRDKERSRSREKDRRGKEARERAADIKEREEIITIDDELIDLTGDISDGKGETEMNGDKSKQSERKRRAAAFLASVGRDPVSVEPPPVIEDNTLASAMVKTLVELRAKKEAAEERTRRREKQKKRHKRREDEMESDRERERSHRKSKRKKHRTPSDEDEEYRVSSSKSRKRKKEKKKHSSSSKSKKHKRTRTSSHESTPSRERRRSETPELSERQGALKDSNGTKNIEFETEVIKNKVKMLREESDEELEVKRWRAESHDSEREKDKDTEKEKEKKEYSEGECESSEEKSKSSSDRGSSESD